MLESARNTIELYTFDLDVHRTSVITVCVLLDTCSFVEESITCGILFESASRSRFCIEMCRSLHKKDTKVEILISCWKEESEN